MKLPSFPFKSKESTLSSWPWPSCGTSATLSFRASDNVYKTPSSTNVDSTATNEAAADTLDSWVTLDEQGGEPLETVIRGLWSERLFFEPVETSSILEEAKKEEFPFKESVVMAMESENPYVDFKTSMEEMVEAHGLKDWECLEELLGWYLRANSKDNHGYIIGAFVDLLLGLAFASSSLSYQDHSSSTTHSFTSPLSFSSSTSSATSPCLYSSEVEDETEIKKVLDNGSSSSSSSSSDV